jgi:hypothetical protein
VSWPLVAAHFLTPRPCADRAAAWRRRNATQAAAGGGRCLPQAATLLSLYPTDNDPAARAAREYWRQRRDRAEGKRR